MAVSGAPWQLECEKMEQRCGYLLTSGQWSDCTFMLGPDTNQTAVPAHKLVLAMTSPVFEAMFFGGLSEGNDPIVQIPDVQPEAFRVLLQYIYTGTADIGSFDMAWDLWYGAKKYMLPHLVDKCNSYIGSVLEPKNACRAYEFACLFDEKTLADKCLKIISTNTKEVLNDCSFVDVQLNTVITVFSLDQLNVDSEIDLFHAVSRYAEAEQKRQGQANPREDKGLPSEQLSGQLLSLSAESSQTSPAAELDTKPSTSEVVSEPIADKEKLKEEEANIRGAVQKIRFLSLSPTQFAESAALSKLLTKDDSLAVFMNIASKVSPLPMPTGFSECRAPRGDSMDQCIRDGCMEHIMKSLKCEIPSQDQLDKYIEAGCLEHIVKALKCGIPSQVEDAARAAENILSEPSCIQQALDKGIMDALVPALTEGNDECKNHAAGAMYYICHLASTSELCVLPEAAALQPFCRLLTAGGDTCDAVLMGLSNILRRTEEDTKLAVLLKLREIGVPQLLRTVQQDELESNRELANKLLELYFLDDQ